MIISCETRGRIAFTTIGWRQRRNAMAAASRFGGAHGRGGRFGAPEA